MYDEIVKRQAVSVINFFLNGRMRQIEYRIHVFQENQLKKKLMHLLRTEEDI